MKLFALTLILATGTFTACTDEKAPLELTAPTPTPALAPSASVVAASASTVCTSYRKELASVDAQLQQSPSSADLLEAKNALDAMSADACN